jgi:hypothetical protein
MSSPISATFLTRSAVLIRLPLWARASEPYAVGWNVGWALCQLLAPVVEYRLCPIARWPLSDSSVDSSKTWETSPMSL